MDAQPLANKKCIPCEIGTPPMTQDEAKKMLEKVSTWQLLGDTIEKHYEFKDFVQSMSFVNKVADVAESEGHHPDISISYNKVTLILTTHSSGGLTENDFIVAAKIDAIGQ